MISQRFAHRAVGALAVIVALAGSLTACAPTPPEGMPFPDLSGVAIHESLGIELPPEAVAFESSQRDRLAALDEWAATIAAQADDDLAAAIVGTNAGAGDAIAPQASGASTFLAARSMPVSAAPTATPGVDVPVVTSATETTTSEVGGQPTTTVSSATVTMQNQVETSTRTATTTAGDPQNPSVTSVTEQLTSETKNTICPPDGEVSGEWKVERVQTVTANGERTELRMSLSGTFQRNKHGTIDLKGVRFLGSGSTTGADGSTPSARTMAVDIDIFAWDTATDVTEAVGRWSIAEIADGVAERDALAAAALMLSLVQRTPKDAAQSAQSDREYGGICARVMVDTHGVTTLSDGQATAFDAWVIDPATSQVIGDATLKVNTYDGSVTPGTATGRTTFTFTAEGDPIYRVSVMGSTPKGGHSLQIKYGATGWKFEGVRDDYTIPTHLGDIAAATVWSGQVCGEVYDQWDLVALITSEFTSHTIAQPMQPVRVEEATDGVRAVLLYELVENPAEGELPFRLWIDEIAPEREPQHSRIEITPEPVEGVCIEQ